MTLQIQNRKPADIKPYWRNPRKNEQAIVDCMESVKRFGFNNPILLDKKGIIICGHTRYAAALRLDLKEVPCITLDIPAKKANQFRIVDNKTSESAEWDMDKLLAELRSIPEEDSLQVFFHDLDIGQFLAGTSTTFTDVTQEDINTRNGELKGAMRNVQNDKLVEVTCPHCAESFQIDRDEIARRSTTQYIGPGNHGKKKTKQK